MRWTVSTNESLLFLSGDGLCCGDDGMALSNSGWFGRRGLMALPLTHTSDVLPTAMHLSCVPTIMQPAVCSLQQAPLTARHPTTRMQPVAQHQRQLAPTTQLLMTMSWLLSGMPALSRYSISPCADDIRAHATAAG